MKVSFSIQTKILIALVFLAVIFISTTLFLSKISQNNLVLLKETNSINSLSTAILALERSNKNYIKNAPRDFESYNRDVQVFHATLLEDVGTIEDKVDNLKMLESVISDLDSSIVSMFLTTDLPKLKDSIMTTRTQWDDFKDGLGEKLGNKEGEPRLEWGATFITEEVPALSSSFAALVNKFDMISNDYQKSSASITSAIIIGSIVILALYIAWFFASIIKPIKQTSNAFKRVSEGDYGYQVPNKRSDEIGELTNAFNSMSSRTELVLSIISQMQNTNHPQKAVEALHQLSASYLKADFVSLLPVNKEYSIAKFSYINNKNEYSRILGKTINIHQGSENDIFLKTIQQGQTININNLSEYSQKNADALLVKELSANSLLQSAIIAPISTDKWKGILVLASNKQTNFTSEQFELIESLSPLIAQGFASSTIRAAAFSKLKATNVA